MHRSLCTLAVGLVSLLPCAEGADLAWDMVGSTSHNLVDFTNFAPVFTSPEDAFGKMAVGVTPYIPPTLVDDTLNGVPSDSLGIVASHADLDELFGICDVDNPDTAGADVSAAWTFDISGGVAAELCLDMAAMGDFEAGADLVRWEIQVDGVPVTADAFPFAVDEGGNQTYTMASGTVVVLDDPAVVRGLPLTNDLRTFCVPVPDGDTLILTLVANTDGGSEGIAVRSIVVRDASGWPLFADGFEDGTTGAWTVPMR